MSASSRAVKLSVRNLYKIFGEVPSEALRMSREGIGKDEILVRTGHTVGVRDATFDIMEGEIFVIMGLSGSGKSTLVRLLNRLIEPTAGQVILDGEDIASLNEADLRTVRRRKVAMVFQSFALMPHLNVLDNVAFGLELAGQGRDARLARAREALAQVGLEAWESSYPDELSGGMQQRVGLARALANDPGVLLMDEAFSALDPLIRSEMQDELLALQAHDRRTIVFISHDLDEAMRIGDRIAIMQGGEVVQVGSPDEILNRPANDYVRSFFRGVDMAAVFTAGDLASHHQVTVLARGGGGIAAAMTHLNDFDREYGYVVSQDRHYLGVVSVDSLTRARRVGSRDLMDALLPEVPVIRAEESIRNVLGQVAQTPCGVPVVDEQGIYRGVLTKSSLLRTLDGEVMANE
ncbi:MAG: glycine betaine/L-proline ABC transporter ATP-binding protein ProV [Halothiobacillaceae bacterium]